MHRHRPPTNARDFQRQVQLQPHLKLRFASLWGPQFTELGCPHTRLCEELFPISSIFSSPSYADALHRRATCLACKCDARPRTLIPYLSDSCNFIMWVHMCVHCPTHAWRYRASQSARCTPTCSGCCVHACTVHARAVVSCFAGSGERRASQQRGGRVRLHAAHKQSCASKSARAAECLRRCLHDDSLAAAQPRWPWGTRGDGWPASSAGAPPDDAAGNDSAVVWPPGAHCRAAAHLLRTRLVIIFKALLQLVYLPCPGVPPLGRSKHPVRRCCTWQHAPPVHKLDAGGHPLAAGPPRRHHRRQQRHRV